MSFVLFRSPWTTFLALLGVFLLAVNASAQAPPKFEVVPKIGHNTSIDFVTFSPDGARFVSVGDNLFKLWDTATGRLLRTFQGHLTYVKAVAFSPDGNRLLSGSDDKDGAIKLWDARTGTLLRTFQGAPYTQTVAFSLDGTRVLAASSFGTIKLWDVASGALLRTVKADARLVSAVLLPDGRILSAGYSRDEDCFDQKNRLKIKLWDATTGATLRTFEMDSVNIRSLVASRDGTTVLSGEATGCVSAPPRRVTLWDVTTGKLLRNFEEGDGATSVAISPDGTRVVASDGKSAIKVWDTATGALLRTFEGYARDVVFSLDGTRVLAALGDPDDGYIGTIKLWEVASGQLIRSFDETSPKVSAVAYSPDGTHLLSGADDKTIRLWDSRTGQLLRTFVGHSARVSSVGFSPDGTRMVSGSFDNTIKLWDTESATLLRSFTTDAKSCDGNESYCADYLRVYSVAFSPDGQRLASASEEAVRLWDTSTGKLTRTFAARHDRLTSVSFSPDGRRIAAGGYDGTVRIWDTASGRLLHSFGRYGRARGTSVVFSSDGARLFSANGLEVALWNTSTGARVRAFKPTSKSPKVSSGAAISRDGRRVFAPGDDILSVWNTATGALERSLGGLTAEVNSLTLSPDGIHIAAASEDGTTRIWRLDTAELLVSLLAATNGEWLAVTPEGFFTASRKTPDTVSIVRGFETFSVDQFFQSLYRPDLVRLKLSDLEGNSRVRAAARKLDLAKVLESGAPPTVTIASPQGGSEVSDVNLAVESHITNAGGGIGRVEWRINGISVGVQNLQETVATLRQAVVVRRPLVLGEGVNVVELVAYNSQNLIASTPVSVAVTAKPSTPLPRPILYVLAIGVSNYADGSLKLNFADADAIAISKAYQQPDIGSGLYQSVDVRTLLDSDVTLQGLKAAFERLGKVVRPNDVFLLYMSGHGITEDGRYYFVPQDARNADFDSLLRDSIGQEQLQEWLTQIPALRSVLIYDTCESGTTAEDQSGFREPQQLVAVEKLSRSMGRTVLAATTDIARAYEGYKNHGIFTFVILSAFAHADANRDGQIEVSALAKYLADNLPALSKHEMGREQIPQIKITGSDFALINRSPASAIDAVRK